LTIWEMIGTNLLLVNLYNPMEVSKPSTPPKIIDKIVT